MIPNTNSRRTLHMWLYTQHGLQLVFKIQDVKVEKNFVIFFKSKTIRTILMYLHMCLKNMKPISLLGLYITFLFNQSRTQKQAASFFTKKNGELTSSTDLLFMIEIFMIKRIYQKNKDFFNIFNKTSHFQEKNKFKFTGFK